jgi:arylsulfatase A-like enzyme
MRNIHRKPNIFLIVLDTHRFDRLGMYGYPKGASPHLDAFASQATVFERAITPGQWTIPAHASMFTGEYPTTHQTTQSQDMLDPFFRTAAEWMRKYGYTNAGFCNNPLVGVIDNGFKRGFNVFYNYGGAVPTTPARDIWQPVKLLSQVWSRYTQLLRRISYPVQNAVARSDRIFRLTLHPMLVPLWTRFANFKGNTPRALRDAKRFVERNLTPSMQDSPQFIFINLMETHLPFTVPEPFTARYAPTFTKERAARDFMRVYNTQALRWLLPMDEPFDPLEAQTLSEMYDAEVAYQDHLLSQLLQLLDEPYHRENSAVIIVADHGEMLGEHNMMGHGFGVFEELVRVPMILRAPGQTNARRVSETVSTVQIFHTLLDLAHLDPGEIFDHQGVNIEALSLARFDPRHADPLVVSEAYPPQNVIKIMEKDKQALMDDFASRMVFRAAYNQSQEKLVRVEGRRQVLYNLKSDPSEKDGVILAGESGQKHRLEFGLDLFFENAVQRQPQHWSRGKVAIEDRQVLQRLRDLGYIE